MKRGRKEIFKRIKYHENPEWVKKRYLKVFASASKEFRDSLEKTHHNWNHRFFWGWYSYDDHNEIPCKLNSGEYYYTFYELDCGYGLFSCNDEWGTVLENLSEVEAYIASDPIEFKFPLDRGSAPAYREKTNAKARQAIYAWLMCARRLGLLKDVARLIGRKCWAERFLWME